jgi:hypothetical protein
MILLLSSKGSLKSGLQPVLDYRCLVSEIWEFLVEAYGGGPVVKSASLFLNQNQSTKSPSTEEKQQQQQQQQQQQSQPQSQKQ